MRESFDSSLDRLAAMLREEGELVAAVVRGAVAALGESDSELADEVIAADDAVDAHFYAIQRSIERLLACEAPVAGDLRLVLAGLRVNIHLERMADLAVNVAKLAKLVPAGACPAEVRAELAGMTTRLGEMIRLSLESFAERDALAARSLVDLDRRLDEGNRRVVQLLSAGEPPAEARTAMLHLVLVARCLERIGDNAVDIGERAHYLVTGEHVEFEDASRPAA